MFASGGFAQSLFGGDGATQSVSNTGNPANPGTPDLPSNPGSPGTPGIPGTPNIPSTPSNPGIPPSPGVPLPPDGMPNIGTEADFLAREKSTLPAWFSDNNPILDALLRGLAASWSWVYSLYLYAKLQTRIRTATDGWLDLIAGDFFGTRIARRGNQTDESFRATIVVNLFRERATRSALIQVLTELTGRTPILIEPQRPADCGAYGVPTSGYGVAGYYGSMQLPSQAFLIAFRPASAGIPNIAGYGNSQGAYGTPPVGMYGSLSMVQGQVTDADILAAIDSVKPVGTVIWTTIRS